METIRTQSLCKQYREVFALRPCTFVAKGGEVVGLLGPNGAGKTTLIRLLMGFIQPTSGTGQLVGFDIVKQSVLVREQVAYLPGDARLPRSFSGQSILEMWSSLHPRGSYERARAIAQRLDLELKRKVALMSTGMRQKLALSVVMSIQTPLLILDEPTANLDPTVRYEVLELVREAKMRGQTVLFSNHVLSEMEETCDRVMFLKSGELVNQLNIDSIKDRTLIRAVIDSSWWTDHPLPMQEDSKHDIQLLESHHIESKVQLLLDVRGDLASILNWLAQAHPYSLKLEPIGLRAEYQRIHGERAIS